jgi:hypothetical protein
MYDWPSARATFAADLGLELLEPSSTDLRFFLDGDVGAADCGRVDMVGETERELSCG